MPKREINIIKFDGESSRVSKEDSPPYLFQKVENWRPSNIAGSLVKRTPYTNILTSGITSLQNMKEFQDANGGIQLVTVDNNAIEESVYSSGYGALAAPSNDERTSGKTVYGTQSHPIAFNNELRSGAGVNAATDYPFWYGYIAETKRFNDAVTITAGKYLDNQVYATPLKYLTNYSLSLDVFESKVTDTGAAEGNYRFWASPVYDGYQRGFPELLEDTDGAWIYSSEQIPSGTYGAVEMLFNVAAASASDYKRITAFDIFVQKIELNKPSETNITDGPIYFLERIDRFKTLRK